MCFILIFLQVLFLCFVDVKLLTTRLKINCTPFIVFHYYLGSLITFLVVLVFISS